MTTTTMDYTGLSCYTANLTRYLAGEWDAAALVAKSVRLAVRVDLPGRQLAFSHHDPPLNRLPDGGRLRYTAGSLAVVLAGLDHELRRYGRALVVVDSGRLPWSPGNGPAATAPHWLLVDRRRHRDWHVVDEFSGLLPAGQQEPYQGWLTTDQLTGAMRLTGWRREQRRRNRLAFGLPVPVPAPPAGGALWLRRIRDHHRWRQLPGRWLVGDAAVLPFLSGYYADSATARDHPPAIGHLEDCWAAAGHRAYAYRWRLAQPALHPAERARLTAALDRWVRLPRALRFAVESAQRGRPRPALVRKAIDELQQIELAEVHCAL